MYKTPPIVEATIEFRVADPVPLSDAQKVARRLASKYASNVAEKEVEFSFDPGTGRATWKDSEVGNRLDSEDRAEIALCRKNLFAAIQLAPYPGWPIFRDRFQRDWANWQKVIGRAKLSRVGVRFQNRLDVPRSLADPLLPADFLNILPKTPLFGIPRLDGYGLTVLIPMAADRCKVTINSGIAMSPLPGAQSLSLDIDLYRDVELPLKDADIWGLLERMHDLKNEVFEACITDKARALFNQ